MFKTTLTAGFAMFSMFFGSGNLVFPLLLGTKTLSYSNFGMMGFFLTAVMVPFIGLIAMIVFEGQREKFFDTLGHKTGFIMTFIMLALMGPFGVIPRCITVAYGGLKLLYPELSFALFSAIFCLFIMGLIWRSNKVVSIIGLVLTPFKLGGIVILILLGLYFASDGGQSVISQSESFKLGFTMGYQTMDLIAAFFFSATIVGYLRDHMEDKRDIRLLLRSSVVASLIGALLLSVIYMGFVSLGAKYAPFLGDSRPEALLAAIANHTLGHYALWIVSVTLAVSCLATAVILSTLFVDFMKIDVAEKALKKSFSEAWVIIACVTTTYVMSLLGFSTICQILGTVLELAYPALIALALHHILSYWLRMNHAKLVFWSIFSVSIGYTWLV